MHRKINLLLFLLLFFLLFLFNIAASCEIDEIRFGENRYEITIINHSSESEGEIDTFVAKKLIKLSDKSVHYIDVNGDKKIKFGDNIVIKLIPKNDVDK
jgi:hypothetical protein